MSAETALKVVVSDNDGPVCLTNSAPDQAAASLGTSYEVIPDSVVARSGVLSSISEAGGDAKLPDVVTLSDFKVWRDTITDDKPVFLCNDFIRACTALKIADAVDDKCFGEWLKVTGEMLINRAIDHNRSSRRPSWYSQADESATHDPPQELSTGLAALPEHLVLRVVEALTEDDLSEELGILLDVVPSQYHAAIVATTLPSSNELRVVSNSECVPYFNALAALPATLLSLTLGGYHLCSGRAAGCKPQRSTAQDKAAAVAAVLQQHPSLTRLRLSSQEQCMSSHPHDTATMPALAPAISTLTALQHLHLSYRFSPQVDHLPQLKVALRSLARLERLDLHISASPKPPTPPTPQKPPERTSRKRVRDSKPAASATLTKRCLAGPLSALTALTHLSITDGSRERQFKATVPLGLPRLNHLRTSSRPPNVAGALLSKLTAPLSTIVFRDESRPLWGMKDVPDAKRLWAGLAKCDQLKSIVLSMESSVEAPDAKKLFHRAPEALGALSSLQELDISGDVPVLSRVMQSLASNSVSVQRLKLQCGRKVGDGFPERFGPPEWPHLLKALGQMTRLKHIDFHVYAISAHCPGLAPLAPLTQLTALHVFAWWTVFNKHADCQALTGMKELRSLCVDNFAVLCPERLNADLVRGLGALPHLQELGMVPNWDREDERRGFEMAFVQHAPWAAWPSLQWISFYAFSPGGAVDKVRAVARCPVLKEVRMSDGFDPWSCGSTNPSLHSEPDHPLYQHSQRAKVDRIAAESVAGFKVTVGEQGWSRFEWKSEWM